MHEFRRARHRIVTRVLDAIDSGFMKQTRCYFGGGTRVVLELDEYRESMDVDFLCADRDGYRAIRADVTQRSVGRVFSREPTFLRDVRADMYGIRTFLSIDDMPLKFEIIAEGRIPLDGSELENVPVPVLDHGSTVAEKFLANTDRGRDRSVNSRDLIDLAFMAAAWPRDEIDRGLEIAGQAYGAAVERELAAALQMLEDPGWRRDCLRELAVETPRRLTAGLKVLRELI